MMQVLKAAKADIDERWDIADVEALLLYAKKVRSLPTLLCCLAIDIKETCFSAIKKRRL